MMMLRVARWRVTGPVLISQDDVKIEEQVSCDKIRLVAFGVVFMHEP